jgi:hypothetical protein
VCPPELPTAPEATEIPTIHFFDTANHENRKTKYPANQFFSSLLEIFAAYTFTVNIRQMAAAPPAGHRRD